VSADTAEGTRADQVRLVAPTAAVESVLERTGLGRILPVFGDRDAALAG
jgi:hypothetical protein